MEIRLGTTIQDLIQQGNTLLEELSELREYLESKNLERTVECRVFQNNVKSELKSLGKLASADPTAERTIHTLRSSNLPFFAAIWSTAKSCTGLVSFNTRFYWDSQQPKPSSDAAAEGAKQAGKSKQRSAIVDIVAQNGLQWVKVSTVSESRLLFELAKAGWECADSSDENEGDEPGPSSEDDDELSLIKLAQTITRAARATRIRYRHPEVCFVLPKVRHGVVSEIDRILGDIRATGASVQCAQEISKAPMLDEEVKKRLTVDEHAHFSETLNIDCTILLALVSDLSHGEIPKDRAFHRHTLRQIETEAKERLLPGCLWPALGSHAMVCTAEAARRMREIVDLIGTEHERMRTALIMGDYPERSREELVTLFGEITVYDVPRNWNLPIRVVDGKLDEAAVKALPKSCATVEENLTSINRSVFVYGWATGLTTISSNKTVAKLIETLVEKHRRGENERGPEIWICNTARSLIGKEINRR
ncbi:MAG: hypothetical protein M1829_004287 [Trizodia sp. TS-e1964]|nr:MAG: hypothetical protein M1829_004287 [Trizodia sp. TS-e1964]